MGTRKIMGRFMKVFIFIVVAAWLCAADTEQEPLPENFAEDTAKRKVPDAISDADSNTATKDSSHLQADTASTEFEESSEDVRSRGMWWRRRRRYDWSHGHLFRL